MIYSENILICIAVPLIVSLLFIQGYARRFVFGFLVGMVTCLLAAYISGYIDLVAGNGRDWTAVYVSPIVEEIMKLLPLLFYLFVFEPGDRAFLLAAVALGAGFATYENCCYILASGAGNLVYVLIRGMAVGVMHIVSTLCVSMGLVLVRRFRALSVPGIVGALALSTTFHGLYNLLVSEPGVSSYIGYVLPLLTAGFLSIPYRRLRGQQTEENAQTTN